MIKSADFKLKQDATIAKGITLPSESVISIVMDVVYVNGYPIPPAFQNLYYTWVANNPTLFENITKNW